jgi:hypothetical protein
VLSHCEFNAQFRSIMDAATVWFGSPEVVEAIDAQEAAMLAQLAVIEAANGGSTDSVRRQQIQEGHAGLRMYVPTRASFLQQNAQCTPAWCAAEQPSTATVIETVTATHQILKVGSGATCTFESGPPPPPCTRRCWGRSAAADCARPGGLDAVGSEANTCACCAAGPPMLVGAPPPSVALPATCPDRPPTGACNLPEDVDGDGSVRVPDLLLLLSYFGFAGACGAPGSGPSVVDVNGDCRVGVSDVLLVLAAFGRTC